MARRLLVSNGSVAKEVFANYKVAFMGLVLPIARALCAQGGVAYQYWPPASDSSDPNILWTNQPFTATKYQTLVNQPAVASITFLADGDYVYTSDINLTTPDNTFATWLGIAVTGTGQYLIKAELVSGSFGGSPLSVWIDAFTPPSYTLTRAITGTGTGVLDISVAAGSVTPTAGTEVVRRVTFNAIIVDEGTKVSWSNTPQWDIEELKTLAPADCSLTFNPNGTTFGDGDTSGLLMENWHEDATIVPDPENYTVDVSIVSGTLDVGSSPTNAPIPLSLVREWTLTAANAEDDLTTVLDVIVSDGVASSTKRVTMHSAVGEEPSTLEWSSTPWSLFAAAFTPNSAISQVILNSDGTAQGTMTNDTTIEERWLSVGGTDPENYEAMCVVTAGSSPELSGPTVNVWHPLSSQLLWQLITVDTVAPIDLDDAEWEIRVRRIGQPSVNKQVLVQNIVEGDA